MNSILSNKNVIKKKSHSTKDNLKSVLIVTLKKIFTHVLRCSSRCIVQIFKKKYIYLFKKNNFLYLK